MESGVINLQQNFSLKFEEDEFLKSSPPSFPVEEESSPEASKRFGCLTDIEMEERMQASKSLKTKMKMEWAE